MKPVLDPGTPLPRHRRRLLAAGGALGVVLGLALPRLWRTEVVAAAEEQAARLLGHRVVVGGLRPSWRGLVATDVQVFGSAPFASAVLARAGRVGISLGGAGGFLSPSAIEVDELDVDYVRAGGTDNVARAGGPAATPEGGVTEGGHRAPPRLDIHGFKVRAFVQFGSGARATLRAEGGHVALSNGPQGGLTVDGGPARLEVAGRITAEVSSFHIDGTRSPRQLSFHAGPASVRVPGAAPVVTDLSLDGGASSDGVTMTVTPGTATRSGAVSARLEASGAGVRLSVDVVGLPLGPLDPLVRASGLSLTDARLTLRGAAELDPDRARVRFTTRTDLSGLELGHPAVDRRPWSGLSLHADVPGELDLTRPLRLRVDAGHVRLLGVDLQVRGHVEAAPTGPVGEVALSVVGADGEPSAACAPLLALQAAPVQDVLRGLELEGRLGLSAHARFDAAQWQALELDVDVVQRCAVTREPDVLDAAHLASDTVVYSVADADGRRTPHPLGPGSATFVALKTMPAHLPAAFVTSEDSGFWGHAGFDLEMIRRAAVYDVEVGAFAKGASTISQQLAKNLFLDQGKTMARKLEETVLTWRIEALLPKSRILELYLNAIELGPGVFGVRRAAELYFGKDVRDLTPLESAHLASLAPNPRGLSARFREGRVDIGWLHHLYDLLAMMKRSGRLSASDMTAATQGTLTLRRI